MKMKTTPITDLKLAAFLRLMIPDGFKGINRNSNGQVTFLFQHEEVDELVTKYLMEDAFNISPLQLGNQLDQCKRLIFQGYQI